MAESYPHLDYDLILEKILEVREDFKTYWKSWRKSKDATLESHIDPLIMNQVMEQGIIEDEQNNPEQTYLQLKETETLFLQPNCESALRENVETTESTNATRHLQLMDNFDDQEITVIDSTQLPKITKIDTQTQFFGNYNKEERERKFVQFELVRNPRNQILRFDNRKALLWEPNWHRKKARVRFKCDIKCYLTG